VPVSVLQQKSATQLENLRRNDRFPTPLTPHALTPQLVTRLGCGPYIGKPTTGVSRSASGFDLLALALTAWRCWSLDQVEAERPIDWGQRALRTFVQAVRPQRNYLDAIRGLFRWAMGSRSPRGRSHNQSIESLLISPSPLEVSRILGKRLQQCKNAAARPESRECFRSHARL
jgi:hypothetical protein